MSLLSIHNRIARRDMADRMKAAESRLATVQTVLYNVLARHGAQEFVVADLLIPRGCFVKCDTLGDGAVRFSATFPEFAEADGKVPFKLHFEGDKESEGTTHGEEAGQDGGVEAGVAEVGDGDAKA